MKKYIVILAAMVLMAGCGADSKEVENTSTTEIESSTEETTEKEQRTTNSLNSLEEEASENEESTAKATVNADNSGESTVEKSDSFEESKAYGDLKTLGDNAGFDFKYENGTAIYSIYITDDTIDYIKEKNQDYYNKWDENCGLYEEFSSEAMRVLSNNNVTGVGVTVQVVGRSDNQVYFKNENGASVFNAYNS